MLEPEIAALGWRPSPCGEAARPCRGAQLALDGPLVRQYGSLLLALYMTKCGLSVLPSAL